MLSYVKKLFNSLIKEDYITSEDNVDYELIELIERVLDRSNEVSKCLKDSVNKLYILNTYTTSFLDLEANVLEIGKRNLIAIPVSNYFRGSEDKFIIFLERLIDILGKRKLPSQINHDIKELIDLTLEVLGEQK